MLSYHKKNYICESILLESHRYDNTKRLNIMITKRFSLTITSLIFIFSGIFAQGSNQNLYQKITDKIKVYNDSKTVNDIRKVLNLFNEAGSPPPHLATGFYMRGYAYLISPNSDCLYGACHDPKSDIALYEATTGKIGVVHFPYFKQFSAIPADVQAFIHDSISNNLYSRKDLFREVGYNVDLKKISSGNREWAVGDNREIIFRYNYDHNLLIGIEASSDLSSIIIYCFRPEKATNANTIETLDNKERVYTVGENEAANIELQKKPTPSSQQFEQVYTVGKNEFDEQKNDSKGFKDAVYTVGKNENSELKKSIRTEEKDPSEVTTESGLIRNDLTDMIEGLINSVDFRIKYQPNDLYIVNGGFIPPYSEIKFNGKGVTILPVVDKANKNYIRIESTNYRKQEYGEVTIVLSIPSQNIEMSAVFNHENKGKWSLLKSEFSVKD